MAKPAGKTLGGRGSEHDRRFEQNGPIPGSYCDVCYKACLPHISGRCRGCRPKILPSIEKVEDHIAVEQLEALMLLETRSGQHQDPEDMEKALAEIEEAKKIEREDREKRGAKGPHETHRSDEESLDVATKRALAKARAIERERRASAPVVIENCLRLACKKPFERKTLLQEYCSKECVLLASKGASYKAAAQAKAREEAMRYESEMFRVRQSTGSDAGREDRPEVPAQPQGSVEAPPPVQPGEPSVVAESPDQRVEPTEDSVTKDEAPMTTTETPTTTTFFGKTRFTIAQLVYADEQNRAPHWRSHANIAEELKTTQAHMSALLRRYREENNLTAPDVLAQRMAERKKNRGTTPKGEKIKVPGNKKIKIPKTKYERLLGVEQEKAAVEKVQDLLHKKWAVKAIFSKLKREGFTEGQREDILQEARKLKALKAQKKIIHKPVDETAPEDTVTTKREPREPKRDVIKPVSLFSRDDAEQAHVDLGLHIGTCPSCEGKNIVQEMCVMGRAYALRWARLECEAADLKS